jgi:hypothetical protein
LAENHNLPFADSIHAARERVAQELSAQAEQIQKLHQELGELQMRHERTHSEIARQWDAVSEAGQAVAAAVVPKVSPDVALERTLLSVRALMDCASPEEVAQTLSEQASRWGVRAAIFDVRGKSVWGAYAHGFGEGLSDGALRSIVVPLTQDNPFRQLCDSVQDVLTSTEALRKNRNLIEKLKPAAQASILLLPIRSAGTVTGVFYADPGESQEPLPANALKILAEFAGAQIDRLIALSGGAAEILAAAAGDPAAAEPLAANESAQNAPGEIDRSATAQAPIPEAPPSEPMADEPFMNPPGAAEISAHSEFAAEPAPLFTPMPEESRFEEPSHQAATLSSKPEWMATGEPTETTREFPVPEEVVEAQAPDVASEPQSVSTHEPVLDEVAEEAGSWESRDNSTISAPSDEISQPVNSGVASAVEVAELDEAQQKAQKDAKRFAKLLVSEIELYNKGKVVDGRQNHDLYKRLKSDIDRSRLTFEKRFGKGPSPQMDYFHDELVRILAQSDSGLLGPEYPGPAV